MPEDESRKRLGNLILSIQDLRVQLLEGQLQPYRLFYVLMFPCYNSRADPSGRAVYKAKASRFKCNISWRIARLHHISQKLKCFEMYPPSRLRWSTVSLSRLICFFLFFSEAVTQTFPSRLRPLLCKLSQYCVYFISNFSYCRYILTGISFNFRSRCE
jgi:hypothetical protein